jgi:Acyl-CoA synthetases (AMP-forming)/AMP-acid ligases II
VVSHALQNKLQNSATIVFATYGMTETITHIAVKQLNNTTLLPNVYTTLPNVNIYKDARNCLVLSAPNVSKTTVFTNDVVNLISDKQFEWLGRYDNVINSGGIKLQPEVIENALAPHIATPFFVIGMSDVVLGEKMVLCIEQKANDKEKAQLFKKNKSP